MRIVINPGYGSFMLSDKQIDHMRAKWRDVFDYGSGMPRNDPLLLEAVESDGGDGLRIVDVDDSRPWFVTEYDGAESVVYPSPSNRGVALMP